MKDKENRHWCSNNCDCQLKIKKLPFYTGLSEGMEMEISKYIAQSIKEEREKTIKECVRDCIYIVDTHWFATGLEPTRVQEILVNELNNLLNKTV